MSIEPMRAEGLRRELEQANVNLNHHLQRQKHHTDEVTRWQEMVARLQGAIDLLEKPAASVHKIREKGAPRIRWGTKWELLLTEFRTANGVAPTKRQLIEIVEKRFQKSNAYANATVNGAINKGDLRLRQDRCYMPETVNAVAS